MTERLNLQSSAPYTCIICERRGVWTQIKICRYCNMKIARDGTFSDEEEKRLEAEWKRRREEDNE